MFVTTIKCGATVLIVRKFNPHIFFGVPLTTKIKQNPYYFPMRFKDREQCVMLSPHTTPHCGGGSGK